MNNIAEQNKKAYNYLAESYANEWANNPDIELADTFISFLPQNARILDVGCGPGQYSLYFNNHGFNIVGVDFSENMISLAKKLNDSIEFNVQDMHNLCFDNNYFDALWVCSSFVHIRTDEALPVLSEFKRILKDDGILFINAIIGNLKYRLESEEEIGGAYKGDGRYFQWYSNSMTFIKLLNTAGFVAEEICRKAVTSQVVENATLRTNQWVNYICKQT